MTVIIPDFVYSPMTTIKKGVSGGLVATIALAVMSCFHGLTPEQQSAGVVVSISLIESLRNILKKKFPSIFGFF